MKKIKTKEDLQTRYEDLKKEFKSSIEELKKQHKCTVGSTRYCATTKKVINRAIRALNKIELFVIVYEELHFDENYDTTSLYEDIEVYELDLAKAIVSTIDDRLIVER